MGTLSKQRCLHHPTREAVARCPECGRFFCRECITEHDDRVVCATCLQQIVNPRKSRRFRLGFVIRAALAIGGLLIAWCYFNLIGSMLLSIPVELHAKTLWTGSEEEP